jgi:hypothetical protein
MRMTAIHAQTERKWHDRSSRCAEKHRLRARTQLLGGLIRPVPEACATAGAARCEKRLPNRQIQAKFTSAGTPLGEFRLTLLRDWNCPRIERRVAAGGHPLG